MVEIDVPDSAGPELRLNYAGEEIRYEPNAGVVTVEERHVEAFMAAVAGSRRHVAQAEPAPPPEEKSRTRAKTTRQEE